MRRLTLALLGLAFLGAGTAAWAAGPPAVAIPALVTPAVSPAFVPPPVDPVLGSALPMAGITCQTTTTCNSCLEFGVKTTFQCWTFCINGVFHRTCNTCGQGCLQA
jgi:hypothetical protein